MIVANEYREVFIRCEERFVKELKIERFIENPSLRDSALYLIHEYLNAHHIAPSTLVNTNHIN